MRRGCDRFFHAQRQDSSRPANCNNLERRCGARGILRITDRVLPMIISARPWNPFARISRNSPGRPTDNRYKSVTFGIEQPHIPSEVPNISRRPGSPYGPCIHGRISASLEANSTVAIRHCSTQQLRLFCQRNTPQLTFFAGAMSRASLAVLVRLPQNVMRNSHEFRYTPQVAEFVRIPSHRQREAPVNGD